MPDAASRNAPNRLLLILILLGSFASAPFFMGTDLGQRSLLALAIFGLLAAITLNAPGQGLSLLLVYSTLLGGLRRWLIPLIGFSPSDPLLLVVPALILLYFLNLVVGRKIAYRTRLEKLVLGLVVVMGIEIFNPLQGGLNIGLAGVLFGLVPVLWFYIGRQFGTKAAVQKLTTAIAVLATFGALYGLKQTYFGFAESEQAWIEIARRGYESLNIHAVRAFSCFASPAEYVTFLSVGVIALLLLGLRGQRQALLPIPILAWAMFITGIRSAVVATLFAGMILWAVQGRSVRVWLPRLMAAGLLAAIGIVWSLGQVEQIELPKNVAAGVQHQSKGLLNPQDSTATGHIRLVFWGIEQGFTYPLGIGLGASTMAAAKYGGAAASSETDLGNAFISLGLIGGVLYVVIVGYVLRKAFRSWHERRDVASLATLGLLVVLLGHWVQGELYSISLLPFFLIGAMGREEAEREAAEKEQKAAQCAE